MTYHERSKLLHVADKALELGRDHLRELKTLQEALEAEEKGLGRVRFYRGVPWFQAKDKAS